MEYNPLVGWLKTFPLPFDSLRANGREFPVADLPFVLSLSKHKSHFFSHLLVVFMFRSFVSAVRALPIGTAIN
jgi:hypothetical protein